MSDLTGTLETFRVLFEECRLPVQAGLLANLEGRIPEAAAGLSNPHNLPEALRAGRLLGVADTLGRLDGAEEPAGEALSLAGGRAN